MSVIIGVALLVGVAIFHHLALELAALATPPWLRARRFLSVIVFTQLALIHLAEVALFALAYLLLTDRLWPESFGGAALGQWSDWLYFSGMIFTTLGYAGIEAQGPLRIVAMLQSLGGFMLLTWSASYLYRTCSATWDR